MTSDTGILVHGAADLVDAAPYVLGFHPAQSMVVLGVDGRRIAFGARYDLPPADDDVAQTAAVVARQRTRTVAVLGYGPAGDVDPVMRRTLQTFAAFRVRVDEALRVHGGRWWSYGCAGRGCCPPEGNPCHPPDNVIAAEATYRGQVVLPNREALVAQVAAVRGERRAAMTSATARALDRLTALPGGDRGVCRSARSAVRAAEKRYRAGRPLTDDEVAWLGVLLADRALEYALDRSDTAGWRIALWTDVLTRVDPRYAPAPACLLAYAAWLDGRGPLARVAVDRALAAAPRHPLARLIDQVLSLGIGPQALSPVDS